MSSIEISIVIPVMNEEESIGLLIEKIIDVMNRIDLSYEIVAVDDGSTDRTFEILHEIAERESCLKVIRFRKNFGQTAAMSAGFSYAKGNVIITLDADLQNDPEDIPLLLEKVDEGYDIVSGWRKDRKDPWLSRKLPSFIANWIISKVTGVRLHDYGCTLKAYKANIIKEVKLYGELHRFIPALARGVGASVVEVPVRHHPRRFGKSKYSIFRTVRVILDLLTVKFLLSYSSKPNQFFGLMGISFSTFGTVYIAYLIFERMVYGVPLSNKPSLLISVMLLIVGVQFLGIGLLGEIMIRTYYESQGKSPYSIKEMLNLEGRNEDTC
ncbi:MAG: glycosyltransferase family 2 protein [Synergistetes bacterium]|nr:glycosyltransferase family 2 protein [Synergistota bacterium]